MIIETSNPDLHITVLLEPAGVGHWLWGGTVRDRDNRVVQLPTTAPVYSGNQFTLSTTTMPAYRFGRLDLLPELVATLRGLVAAA